MVALSVTREIQWERQTEAPFLMCPTHWPHGLRSGVSTAFHVEGLLAQGAFPPGCRVGKRIREAETPGVKPQCPFPPEGMKICGAFSIVTMARGPRDIHWAGAVITDNTVVITQQWPVLCSGPMSSHETINRLP